MIGSGVIEFDPQGRACFRPHVPAFPRLEDIHDVLERTTAAVRRFDDALAGWAERKVIGRLFARLDAVHSSGAEGTTTTFSDLLDYQSQRQGARDPDDAAIVAACAMAFDDVEQAPVAPIDMILLIHHRLFAKARDPMMAFDAGKLKQRTNGTADPDSTGGIFYYTALASLQRVLAEWQDFTLARDPMKPELVRQVLSHWMFEHIHPVMDGNGRIGRLLVPLLLKQKGMTRLACVFFGEAVHEDKTLYVEALKSARQSGDMTAWTRLMLGLIGRTAEANLDRLSQLSQLKEQWLKAVENVRSDSMVHRLVPFALTSPAFTVLDAVREIGGTFASVNTAARRLVDLGILRIADANQRDRLFQAPTVLDIFDRFRR